MTWERVTKGERCAPYYLKKTKVQNMFPTKTNFVAIIIPKALKHGNLLVDVVVVTICNQILKQQTLRQCELMKEKTITN